VSGGGAHLHLQIAISFQGNIFLNVILVLKDEFYGIKLGNFKNLRQLSVTLYNTGALMCINSSLTNAQIIMS